MDNVESGGFASAKLTSGQLNAIVKKLGGYERALSFLRGEISVTEPKWREQNGVIRFSVISDGTTGDEWIKRLFKKGFRLGNFVRSILLSPDFKATSGMKTEVIILKKMFFDNGKRTTDNILAFATENNFTRPNPETACLIREMFTDEEMESMGLSHIVIMHDPIEDSAGLLCFLGVSSRGFGRCLSAYYSGFGSTWNCFDGFAFAVEN